MTAALLITDFYRRSVSIPPEVIKNGVLRVLRSDEATILLSAQPLERFADVLRYSVDRPVLDRTEAPLSYSLHPDLSSAAAAGQELGISVFTALQQQLGLKLDAGKPLSRFSS